MSVTILQFTFCPLLRFISFISSFFSPSLQNYSLYLHPIESQKKSFQLLDFFYYVYKKKKKKKHKAEKIRRIFNNQKKKREKKNFINQKRSCCCLNSFKINVTLRFQCFTVDDSFFFSETILQTVFFFEHISKRLSAPNLGRQSTANIKFQFQ